MKVAGDFFMVSSHFVAIGDQASATKTARIGAG